MRPGRFHVDSRHLSIDAYVISAPLCCPRHRPRVFVSSGVGGAVVASVLRVREVADPKGRCAGAGRPRWILETPRSALPGPCQLLGRRRGVAGRSRRRSCVRGSASPPSVSCRRRACSGSRHGLRCRVGSGSSRRCGSCGHRTVAGSGETVANGLARGRLDRGGAGPGRGVPPPGPREPPKFVAFGLVLLPTLAANTVFTVPSKIAATIDRPYFPASQGRVAAGPGRGRTRRPPKRPGRGGRALRRCDPRGS